jgi:hypothetical protein
MPRNNEESELDWRVWCRQLAATTTGDWAISVLESRLGPDYLRRAYRRERATGRGLLFSEAAWWPVTDAAAARIVELALALEDTVGVPGWRTIRDGVAEQPGREMFLHGRTVWHLGSLLRNLGTDVVFEPRLPTKHRADLLVGSASSGVHVEVTTLGFGERWLTRERWDEAVSRTLLAVHAAHGVHIELSAVDHCDEEELRRWATALERAARTVCQRRPKTDPSATGGFHDLSQHSW